ncbi:ZYRO0D12540p [Zygosaccharomyces rouxii]|uniref:ZYRO0D12540p n=1 Tax=Zygosaccharomyces rouxii (strain ATCC 2623 / CBS 732 / NBRC 1130 / NCYC 568 / NRRL Y-229) TaxID=559307 RepID=C5DW75_ZYGRC|nr:uncharacterized protein ZYRO0D12540g [Zygosaccharomyces rouxii]KAH9200953.1 hypothetical protein LQ764DRAFT_234124 [Zygosaccharomyces rouxii]CAR28044.1 ZYRO0D12540p [Zygosaccharomyces rouxii]
MHKSVRVGDYFSNDDNGLWSWYLTNIRNGDFEELTRNQLKHSLFKRFLRTYLEPTLNERKDTKVLIVSIPEDVRRDITLLEYFLGDYLNLDNMEITKLTTSRIYNHENHYVVMDKENNFKNSNFLHFASTNIQTGKGFTGGELAGTTVAAQAEKNISPTESAKFRAGQGLEPSDDTEGDEESLVFNFTHRDHHLTHPLRANGKEQEEAVGVSPSWNPQQQQRLQEHNASNDEMASIDSYNLGSNSSRVVESFKGEPLTLTMTRTEDFSSSDEYDSLASSPSSSDTDLSSFESCSLMSILPSISIADSFGHFRLVLQSVLFINPTSNEIFTAIRQSNNKPTKADVDDDWLLYDSQFSMHNLQMLTLQDLSELNKGCPKVLFYSLVEVVDTPSLEDADTECATISNTASTSLSSAPTSTSVSCEPRVFFPSNVNGDNSGCRLAKGNTNSSTLGHRSIVTTNSAADWRRQSVESNASIRKYDSTAETYKGLNATHAVGIMERTRSTPLPTALKTISGSDRQRNKKWKGEFKRRGHGNAIRRFADDKGCIIC